MTHIYIYLHTYGYTDIRVVVNTGMYTYIHVYGHSGRPYRAYRHAHGHTDRHTGIYT